MPTLDEMIQMKKDDAWPSEQEKHFSLDEMISNEPVVADPATAPKQGEDLPSDVPDSQIGIGPLAREMALYAGGIGAGSLAGAKYGKALGPWGAAVGAGLGGAIAAMSNKGYEQGIPNTNEVPKSLASQYGEQLSRAPRGFGMGLSAGGAEAAYPAKVGIESILGAGSARKGILEAGKQVAGRGAAATGAAMPFEIAQEKIDNPSDSLWSAAKRGGSNALLYGATEAATSGLGAIKPIRYGARVTARAQNLIPEAEELARALQLTGADPLLEAQLGKTGTFKNRAYNLVSSAVGGGELREYHTGQIKDIMGYTDSFINELRGGVPADRALANVQMKAGQDAIANTMATAGKTINIKNIKDRTGVPSIAKELDATNKIRLSLEGINTEASNILGEPIPKDAASRAPFFTKKYNNLFDTADSMGVKVDTSGIRNTVGIPPKDAQVLAKNDEWLSKLSPADQAIAKQQLGVSGNTGDFEKILENGRIQGFTTNTAKKLVSSMSENPSFREAHALRSTFGQEMLSAKNDPSAREIFRKARQSIDDAMTTASQSGGLYDNWKKIDTSYNQQMLYEDLTDKMLKQFSEERPIINKRVAKGQGLTEYLDKSKEDLLNISKLSPAKYDEIKTKADDLFNMQNKDAALQNVTDDAKFLYPKQDNITLPDFINIENDLIASLEKSAGPNAARITQTLSELRTAAQQAADGAGVGAQWQQTQKLIRDNKLADKLQGAFTTFAVYDKDIGGNIINGKNLLKYLENHSDKLKDVYGMTPDHLKDLKSLAKVLDVLKPTAEPGKGVLAGMQMSPVLRPSISTDPGVLAKTATNLGSVLYIPQYVSKTLLAHPYLVNNSSSASLLAGDLEKLLSGNKATYQNVATVFGKAYAAYQLDQSKEKAREADASLGYQRNKISKQLTQEKTARGPFAP